MFFLLTKCWVCRWFMLINWNLCDSTSNCSKRGKSNQLNRLTYLSAHSTPHIENCFPLLFDYEMKSFLRRFIAILFYLKPFYLHSDNLNVRSHCSIDKLKFKYIIYNMCGVKMNRAAEAPKASSNVKGMENTKERKKMLTHISSQTNVSLSLCLLGKAQ